MSTRFRFSRKAENLIAEFLGFPKTYNKLFQKKPKPLDELLNSGLKRLNTKEFCTEGFIVANWETILGSKHAHLTFPQTIANGILVIKVANPTARNVLKFERKPILSRLQSIPQCAHLKDISFKL